jgi:trehalose 6-phosphate synthase/phosphatase
MGGSTKGHAMRDSERVVVELGRNLRARPSRLLVLDYDGTLVPFAAAPAMAVPDAELQALLVSLATTCDVYIVSGRDRHWMDAWFGKLPLGLYAEHGFWARRSSEPWRQLFPLTPDLTRLVPIFEELVWQTPGSFLETKTASLAWHYRLADAVVAGRALAGLQELLVDLLPRSLELVSGSRVLEVRPRFVSKGEIVRALVQTALADSPALGILIAGSHRDDETMFSMAPQGATTIRIGDGYTRARHRLADVRQLRALLEQLT